MTGKHAQLIVTNYDQTGSSTEGAPLSYFRLGAAVNESDADEPLASKTLRGDDLIDSSEISEPTDPRLRFKDDWRSPTKPNKTYYEDDGTDGEMPGREETDRIELSKALISRGGWRDHTDGNRISTTRGDCVEVIGGNYKLIVLGRVASGWDPAGLGKSTTTDFLSRTRQEVSSGGHYNESTSTPGELVSVTWSATNEGGTWTTVEQTDHGNVKSIYKGYIEQYHFGPSITSTVGKEINAYTIEESYDTGEKSTAGAHAAELPDVTEVTYARSIKKQEHYDTLTEKTTINGVGKKEDKRHINVKAHSKAVYNTSTDLKRQCFFKESLYATNHNVADGFKQWRRNYTFAAVTLDLSFVGFTLTKTWGSKTSFSWALSGSLEIAGSVALNIGMFFGVRIGTVDEFAIGRSTTVDILRLEGFLSALGVALFQRRSKAVTIKTTAQNSKLCGVKLEG